MLVRRRLALPPWGSSLGCLAMAAAASFPPSGPAFERLVDLLFAGLAERPVWGTFRAALAEAVGATEAVVVLKGGGPGGDTTVIGGDGRNLAAVPLLSDADIPDGVAQVLTDIAGFARVAALRLALPDGLRGALLLGTAQPEPAPHRPRWDEPGALALLAALAPHLGRALPLYAAIAAAERGRLVADYVLESSAIGVVLVEGDGTVLAVNATARAIMARTPLLAMRGGRLVARAQADQAALRDAVAAMARAQGPRLDPDRHVSFAMVDSAETARLTLNVRPGPPYWPVSAPLRRTAVVIVRDPGLAAPLPPGDLVALFGLTPAEARLAARIADGAGLDEAAEALGVTRNTARSQLQAIFAKTGVNRQGELVRLLLGSAAANVSGVTPEGRAI